MIGILTAQSEAAPAGGAAIGEVIGATAGATILTLALFALGWAHRTGRTGVLDKLADGAAQRTGAAPWAALPGLTALGALLIALFGMYWDISLHIDNGRDAGPLANPAHYFILAGLFGIFVAGFLAVVLPKERPGRAAVRISGDWYAPVGGIVLLATSAFALTGFPLDDMWHRLFGQDVTLWGPTHLMMIGGAGLALIGSMALAVEGGEPRPSGRYARGVFGFMARTRYAALCGGLLVGLSTFQAEFDFGVPQFRLLFQPVLIAAAGAIALVAARIYTGRGGALAAAGYFIVIRGVLAVAVGPVLGQTTPHLPLYLAEAALVELVAIVIPARERPYALGAIAGALIGTVGFAAEYGFSHLWMPIAWPESLIDEAIPWVPIAGIAGGLIGGFVGTALFAPRRREPASRPRLAPAAVGLAALIAIFAYGLDTQPEQGVRAQVTVRELSGGPERTVEATARISPPEAAENANWLNVTAWQGGGLVVNELERVGPGTYRSTEPIPVYGEWKSILRLHRESSIAGVPIFQPRDPAIPAPEVPASAQFERPFVADHEILQREQKDDVAPALPLIAFSTVGGIALVLTLALGWALWRLAGVSGGGPGPSRRPARARRPLAPASPGGAA